MSSLKDFVRSAVPNMAPDDEATLVRHLEGLGIRTREDCSRVDREQLRPLRLPPLQFFKFVDACSRGKQNVDPQEGICACDKNAADVEFLGGLF